MDFLCLPLADQLPLLAYEQLREAEEGQSLEGLFRA